MSSSRPSFRERLEASRRGPAYLTTTYTRRILSCTISQSQHPPSRHPRLVQEKQATDDGALDIVCGFMVIDEDSRTIVLEGASGPKGGLTTLLKKVGRAGPNGQAYRALQNPEVRFSRRLYTSFDADLKKVCW